MFVQLLKTCRWAPAVLTALALSGCDLAELMADPRVAQREADGKAIGAACRHALRGIEDCYFLNPKAQKTAIFAGWREMDQYMRENNLQGQAPMVRQGVEAPKEEIIEEKTASSGPSKTAKK